MVVHGNSIVHQSESLGTGRIIWLPSRFDRFLPSLVILNPEAGRVRKSLTRVRGRLADHLASADGDVRVARAWEETRDHASAATEAGFDRVVAAGGDGTVNAVVNGLMEGPEPRPTVAVLPLGTGNDLARSLAVDPDLEGGLRSLERNDRRLMDLISVERSDVRRIAANVSAGGFSGQVDGSLTGEAKERWGPLAYLKTAVESCWVPARSNSR